jgi:hypothetical protein
VEARWATVGSVGFARIGEKLRRCVVDKVLDGHAGRFEVSLFDYGGSAVVDGSKLFAMPLKLASQEVKSSYKSTFPLFFTPSLFKATYGVFFHSTRL